MSENKIPEVDRRKKETGLVNHITETLTGKQSRKVAFGIWLFIVANGFKARMDMPWGTWWNCVLLSGALIGLGTLLDDTLTKVGDLIAIKAANSVKTVLETETKTTVTVDAPPTPEPPPAS